VHFAGIPCEMESIHSLAGEHSLFVLEDCAHAVETEYRGQPVGTASGSRFAAYSFYATKNLICGEGGMLACAEGGDRERASVMGLHGMSADAWKRYSGDGFALYDIVAAGYKYNMFDMQAALGLVQLAKLDSNWQRRRALVQHYDELIAERFSDGSISVMQYPQDGKSAHHLYVARLQPELAHLRDDVIRGLLRRNIQAYVHYPCLTGTSFYRSRYGTDPAHTPVSDSLSQRSITLPLYPDMLPSDVEDCIEALAASLAEVC
jgi:dTDP-4-amino-4,6-dideoxygalactose transaminase